MVIIVWLYCFHIYKCALDVAELRSLSSSLSGVGVTWSGRLAGASGTQQTSTGRGGQCVCSWEARGRHRGTACVYTACPGQAGGPDHLV